MSTIGGEKETEWEKLALLPSVTVEGVDLDIVDLRQRGVTAAQLQLTTHGCQRLQGAESIVIRDVEATPLLLCKVRGTVLDTVTLRPVEPFLDASIQYDLAVVVKGSPSRADLARVEMLSHGGMRIVWLVLTSRSREGRAFVAYIQSIADAQVRADHTVTALPWPGESAGQLLVRPRLPGPDEIARSLGALHYTTVGESDSGAMARDDRGGTVVFFTGLSGSGKSTVAKELRNTIEAHGDRPVTLLDGDDVRRMLTAGLGFDEASRAANVRRVSWVAALLAGNGGIAITALIAPFAEARAEARRMALEGADFVLVWVSTPLAECERRDRKGLYAQARAGQLGNFTGIDSPYEPPEDADLVLDTTQLGVNEAVDLVIAELDARARRRGTEAFGKRSTPHTYHGVSYDI